MSEQDFQKLQLTDQRVQEIIDSMDSLKILLNNFRINVCLSSEDDLRTVFKGIHKCLNEQTNLAKYFELKIKETTVAKDDKQFAEKAEERFKHMQTVKKYSM